MDKVIVRKLHRKKNSTGSLEISESVTVKTKSQLQKAVIVNLQLEASSIKKKAQASKAAASEPKRSKKKSSRSNAVQDPLGDVVPRSVHNLD